MNKKIIIIVLVVSAVVVAGCVGGGGQAPENGGGDGGGDGDGDGSDSETDGGTDDGDGDSDGDSDGDDGGGADTDGSGGGADGDTDGETGETGDGADGGAGGATTLGNAFSMTEEFAFDAEMEGEQQGTVSGRFHQGNMYIQFESGESSGEFYMVGEDQYMITSGQGETVCMRNPGGAPLDENQIDPDDYESDVSEYPDLTPTGRDTIDGEEVYVYELTPEMTEQSDTITYYVGVSSGHLRRVESPEATVNFHSWNDVDPVEAPNMDCQDMSEMPGAGDMPTGSGSNMPSAP